MKQSTMLAKRIIVRDTTARGQRVEKREKYHTQTNTEKMIKMLRSYRLNGFDKVLMVLKIAWLHFSN